MTTAVADPAERSTRRLRYLQAYEIGASRLLGGWLPGVVNREAKHELARHLWEDAQHSRDLRTRLWELRVPAPDRDLGDEPWRALERLAAARHDAEFLAGAYLVLKRRLREAYLAQLDRYGYDGSLRERMRERRDLTAKRSANPLQRGFAGTTD